MGKQGRMAVGSCRVQQALQGAEICTESFGPSVKKPSAWNREARGECWFQCSVQCFGLSSFASIDGFFKLRHSLESRNKEVISLGRLSACRRALKYSRDCDYGHDGPRSSNSPGCTASACTHSLPCQCWPGLSFSHSTGMSFGMMHNQCPLSHSRLASHIPQTSGSPRYSRAGENHTGAQCQCKAMRAATLIQDL